MARDKQKDAERAAAYRARLRERVAAGDPAAIAQVARARARQPIYHRRRIAAIRSDPERLARERARRAASDREYRERLRAERREESVLDEKHRARARDAVRRYRERLREHLASDEQRALELLSRRRQQDRDSYQRRRKKILSHKKLEYTTRRQEILAANRESYRRNQEKWKPTRAKWFAAHADEQRARQREAGRAKYAADPEAVLRYNREWRVRNPERARAYVRLSGHRRRAATGGQRLRAEDWFALLERFGHRCAYCGSTEDLCADHRIPLARGGSNTVDNLLPACRSCNSRKHTKTEDEFREYLAQLVSLGTKEAPTGNVTVERVGPYQRALLAGGPRGTSGSLSR